MQKIKTIRWPMRNPMGDRLFYKVFASYGSQIPINKDASPSGFWAVPSFKFNSMSDLATMFGSAPGLAMLGSNFNNYRIRGIALYITAWGPTQLNDLPLYVFAQASSDNTFITPTVNNLPEQRWAKYKLITASNAGARPTVLKVYFSVNKVTGPDQIVKNDVQFTGNTAFNPSPTSWVAPASGPYLRFGVFSMTQTNPAATFNVPILVRMKVYTQFWGKAELTS